MLFSNGVDLAKISKIINKNIFKTVFNYLIINYDLLDF